MLLGGWDGFSFLSDMWGWNGTTWSTVTNFTPPARDQHAMVYDAAHAVTLLFGGQSSGGFQNDTWE